QALVDEARAGVVLVFARPFAQQVVVQRGATLVAALGLLPRQRRAHRIHALELLLADGGAHFIVIRLGALRHGLPAGLGIRAGGVRQDLLDLAGALPARRRRLGVRAHFGQRG